MVRRYAYIYAQILCFLYLSGAAYAQSVNPILPTGDAAVAGFSGTVVIGSPPPPEARRLDKTYINLDGPALRVVDLTRMGGPPQGQLVNAAKLFTATARQIGQVFSLALDDANPPNIYAAASSAYGLPIVVPDADGDGVPDRARRGAPNAAFMPGLFGPITLDGGPGSIWKINGSTGAVTLFANVMLSGVPNSGPALGGLAFDPASRQLFVADRDTGLIHRFTLDGVERGRFDHGSQALSAAGLPPIGFDPRKRLNIESPAFDTGNPATWAYAPPARRVFGMAVNGGRLYYAVAAGLRIWSVSLLPDGSFGPDARGEVSVPRGALPNSEVSEILFDDNGDMLVAERGAPTGAYDYKALAESPENRVLRFRPKTPNDPPSRDFWFPVPKEYAIGFPPTLRNDNGGIAIGYGYDPAGNINRAVCGGTLWSTGEQLRNARDRAIIQRLQAGGPLIVDGLQGNSTRLLRPLNEPPFEAYFIDYDDRFDDPQTRGYLGDVVIWRVCGQAALPLIPVVLVCPPGLFNVDGFCRFPLTCPAGTEYSDGCCGYRGCPASYVRINGKCVPPQTNCNAREVLSEGGRCESPKCPAGMVYVDSNAGGGAGPGGLAAPLSGATNNALQNALQSANGGCPAGTVLSADQCQPVRNKPKMCSGGGYCKCPEGTRRSEDGTCKQSSCGPGMVDQGGECVCDTGWQGVVKDGHYSCVQIAQCNQSPAQCCPSGWNWNLTMQTCEPPVQQCNPSDPTTMVKNGGQCVCKDGSSASGGRFNGSNVASGSALDGVFQSGSGQNCCPTDRRFNAITNKCDPVNPGTPHLKIIKLKEECTHGGAQTCRFTIQIINVGNAPYTGLVGFQDILMPGSLSPVNGMASLTCTQPYPADGANIGALGTPGTSPAGSTALECGNQNVTLQPNEKMVLFFSGVISVAQGVKWKNCAALVVDRTKDENPTDHVSCVNGGDNPQPLCPTGSFPIGDGTCVAGVQSGCQPPSIVVNGTCCTPEAIAAGRCGGTTTTSCPKGARMGLNGQCYFVDPGCQGPNCGPVTTGCPDGGQRNLDGICPTPTTTTCTYPPNFMVNGMCCNARSLQDGSCGGGQTSCQFPKILSGGQCVCRGGTVGDDCHVPTTTACTGGKIFSDGACRCPYGMKDNGSGTCVRTGGDSKKTTPRKPRKPTKPDSDNPAPSGPQFNIQIGPGFPGGGRPHTPTQPRPPSGGSGCGARCG